MANDSQLQDSALRPVSKRVGENGQGHRSLAADVIGQNAAEQPADAPAEHRDGDHRARIGGNEFVLRRVEQLVQRRADREDEGEDLKSVERPAQVRRD